MNEFRIGDKVKVYRDGNLIYHSSFATTYHLDKWIEGRNLPGDHSYAIAMIITTAHEQCYGVEIDNMHFIININFIELIQRAKQICPKCGSEAHICSKGYVVCKGKCKPFYM